VDLDEQISDLRAQIMEMRAQMDFLLQKIETKE
jgi:hypothetical protein